MNEWIIANEALWLFWLIFSELIVGTATLTILVAEYFYDKKVYESKRRSIKRTKNKVVITQEDGQVVIKEAPKNIDVVIERKGA